MLKKTITYTDYNDTQRTEDFYFNLSQPELMKMQNGIKGGLDVQLKGLVNNPDGGKIIEFFEELIFKSYGEKSEDGSRFIKSEELSRAFTQTPAYEVLLMDMLTNPDTVAADFVNGVIPKKIANKQISVSSEAT